MIYTDAHPGFVERPLVLPTMVLAAAFLLNLLHHPAYPEWAPALFWPGNAVLVWILLYSRNQVHLGTWVALACGKALANHLGGIDWTQAFLHTTVSLSGILTLWYLLVSHWAPQHLGHTRSMLRVLLACGLAALAHTLTALSLLPWVQPEGTLLQISLNSVLSQWLGYSVILPFCLLFTPSVHGQTSAHQAPATQDPAPGALPLLGVFFSLGMCFTLGGPIGVLCTLPSLLYVAKHRSQRATALVLLIVITSLGFGLTRGWLASQWLPKGLTDDNWRMVFVRLEALILIAAPLFLSARAASRQGKFH